MTASHLEAIRILADGRTHSGEDLARELGISRAAVWKALRKAEDRLGIEVRSVRGQGYRLGAPMELLDADQILSGMGADALGRLARLEIQDDLASTNDYLMAAGRDGAPSGTLCLAERQSAGRGRQGRSWVSPFGANLYLSLLWRFAGGPAQLGGLSLAVGVAVAGAVEAQGVREVSLKWPNDLHWHRRKLAGVLVEVAGEAQGPSLVIIGLGLNTRIGDRSAAAIDQPWVDLETILGPGGYSRNRLASSVAAALIRALCRYEAAGLAPFLSEWERLDTYRGETVELRVGDQIIIGRHAGVTPQGALCLERDGDLQTFHAGEVSLRPTAGGR